MTQNKKKGIAKKALSISLVAAMLATSNVPAWASGFEAVDAEGFAVEEAVATDLLGTDVNDASLKLTVGQDELLDGGEVAWGTAVTITADGGDTQVIKVYDAADSKKTNIYSDTGAFTLEKEYADKTLVVEATYKVNESDSITTLTKSFKVAKKTVNASEVTVDITGGENHSYTGSAIEPGVTVTGIGDLAPTDYVVSYKNNVMPGNKEDLNAPTAVVTFVKGYQLKADDQSITDTVEKKFTITGTDVTSAELTLKENAKVTYQPDDPTTDKVNEAVESYKAALASQIKSVTLNGKELTSADYEIAFEKDLDADNNKVGTLNAVVKGAGLYSGVSTKGVAFTVEAKDISGCTIELANPSEKQEYDGSATPKTPALTIKDGNVKLENTDFEAVYGNNILPTTAATAKAEGKGNYKGTTATINFTIINKIDNLEALKNQITFDDQTYTGKDIDPVAIYYGNFVLNRDYTYTIIGDHKNVRDGVEVKFTGMGTYEGSSFVKTFNIKPATLASTNAKAADTVYVAGLKTEEEAEKAYGKPAVTVIFGTTELVANKDYVITGYDYSSAVETTLVADRKIVVTAKGLGNFDGTFTVNSKIVAANISSLTAEKIAPQVYTGNPIYPTIVIKNGEYTLVKDTDFTVKSWGKDNVNVGTVTITVEGKGAYTGTLDITYEIVKNQVNAYVVLADKVGSKVDDKAQELKAKTYSYGDAVKPEGIVLTDGTDFAVVDANGNKINPAKYEVSYSNNKAAGTASIVITGKGSNDIIAANTFVIKPAILVGKYDVVAITPRTYTGSAIEIPASEYRFEASDGSYKLVEGKDYEVSYVNNVNANQEFSGTPLADAKQPKIVIKGLGNYAAANTTYDKTFDIRRAQITTANISHKTSVGYAAGIVTDPAIVIVNPVTKTELVKDVDYTVKIIGGIEIGDAKAEITLSTEAAKNYEFANEADVVNYYVVAKNLNECDVNVVDGKVVVKNGEITVPETEYKVTENADGTYTVVANSKNYTGTITVAAETAPEATTLRVTDRTTSTVSLAWDEVEGAEGYTIWFRSEYETSVSRKIVQGGDVTTWTQKGLQPGTKYFYTVKAWVKDAEGNYVFSEQSPVQRGTTKPLAAKITAVSAVNGKVKVTLAGKAAGAEMYSMCYSKSANFDDFKVGIRTSYTTRTFKNALTAGTYYVRVKSYRDLGNNKRVYGAWSNTMKVVVK